MAFRTFKSAGRSIDLMREYASQPDRDWSEAPELEGLCHMLTRNGVEHSHADVGPWRFLEFESPHGTVRCGVGPGTDGNREGRLECFCEGWDFGLRGNLTAHEAYSTYMTGGW